MSMTVAKSKHATSATVRCDWKPIAGDYDGVGYCDEKFVSFSDVGVVEKQAQIRGWEVKEHYTPKSAGVHLCRKHVGASRYMMPERRLSNRTDEPT